MISFESLDDLKNFLRRDKDQKASNPIRFVNVNSLSEWFEMKHFLETLTTDFIFLSDYCVDNDNFPNLRRLRNDLQKETRNICVLPLSELLRITPDKATYEINRILNYYTGAIYSFRIYFLMYRLKNFFLSLKIDDLRQKNCVLLSAADTTDDYSLTIIQKPLRLDIADECVDGFKKYLQYWEKSPKVSLTFYTENARHLQYKNFFDDVKIIANAFDLLRHRYDLPAELKKGFGAETYWQRLLDLTATTGSVEKAIGKEFGISGFNMSAFNDFGKLEKFRQWLLWLHCKMQSSGYPARCAKASSPEEFVAKIYEMIFSCTEENFFDKLCAERREILSLMKVLPPDSFIKCIRQSDKRLALKILTDKSHAERFLIFETLQKFKLNELDAAQKILRQSFPALAKYLSDDTKAFTAEQAEYFRCYRWLKVTNQLTNDFNLRVTELAHDTGKNIYAVGSRNKLVGEEYSDASAIFFVDGLGAEYLNFFAADFKSLTENFSIKYQVGRCNLPSATEFNKDFLQGKSVAKEMLDLDALKHEARPYPENILCELDFLVTLKEKIVYALDTYEKIILCADHGTSRLAVLARQNKSDAAFPAEGRQVYKSGRFADSLKGDEKIFPTAIENDNKIIFADYSRFVQKGAPGNEIHGGASLEEVLVPVITIERRKNFSEEKKPAPLSVSKGKRGIARNKKFDL